MKAVQQFLVGGLDHNCTYICTDPETAQAAIVDPAGDLTAVHHFLQTQSCHLTAIWLTHTHADHTDGIPEINQTYGALPIYVHPAGQDAVTTYGAVQPVTDQDTLTLGAQVWTVWHTPGHSADAVCFWRHDADQSELLSGDTLFVQGCGRTTRADATTLYDSLQRLTTLPDHTIIYPGHNYGPQPTSTLAEELTHNPYLQATDLEAFLRVRFPHD